MSDPAREAGWQQEPAEDTADKDAAPSSPGRVVLKEEGMGPAASDEEAANEQILQVMSEAEAELAKDLTTALRRAAEDTGEEDACDHPPTCVAPHERSVCLRVRFAICHSHLHTRGGHSADDDAR